MCAVLCYNEYAIKRLQRVRLKTMNEQTKLYRVYAKIADYLLYIDEHATTADETMQDALDVIYTRLQDWDDELSATQFVLDALERESYHVCADTITECDIIIDCDSDIKVKFYKE